MGRRAKMLRGDERAIRALLQIVLSSIGGVVAISLLQALIRGGVIGSVGSDETFSVADESLSILGAMGSSAVGGMCGWLARDAYGKLRDAYTRLGAPPAEVASPSAEDRPTLPAPAPVPAPAVVVDEPLEFPPPDHPDELDDPEPADLTWPDEPMLPDTEPEQSR